MKILKKPIMVGLYSSTRQQLVLEENISSQTTIQGRLHKHHHMGMIRRGHIQSYYRIYVAHGGKK